MSSSFIEAPRLPRADGPFADLRPAFERGAHVVEAAAGALQQLEARLGTLLPRLAETTPTEALRTVTFLSGVIDGARVESENLLVLRRGVAVRPLVVFVLSRTAQGALGAQPIEIDRTAIAMSDGARHESDLPFDRLVRAAYAATRSGKLGEVQAAIEHLLRHARMASSRLSIAKARFDLQHSMLRAVPDAPAPLARGPDEAQAARAMALEARRLLDRAALNILKSRAPAEAASTSC